MTATIERPRPVLSDADRALLVDIRSRADALAGLLGEATVRGYAVNFHIGAGCLAGFSVTRMEPVPVEMLNS
jgi:hypothetical protein